jgi:hypothetical protein
MVVTTENNAHEPSSTSTVGPMVDAVTKVLIARTLTPVTSAMPPLPVRRAVIPSTAMMHDLLRQMRIKVMNGST